MVKIISYLTMIVSVWLGVSGLALGYDNRYYIVVNIIVGLIVLALVFYGMRSPGTQWPFKVVMVLGILLMLWGFAGKLLLSAPIGVNEILIGLVLSSLSALTLPFQLVVKSAEFNNRHGGDLASIKRIRYKDGQILAKAVLLGSMPETIYMSPEEICKVASLIEPKVVLSIPSLLYKGWKKNRAQARTTSDI